MLTYCLYNYTDYTYLPSISHFSNLNSQKSFSHVCRAFSFLVPALDQQKPEKKQDSDRELQIRFEEEPPLWPIKNYGPWRCGVWIFSGLKVSCFFSVTPMGVWGILNDACDPAITTHSMGRRCILPACLDLSKGDFSWFFDKFLVAW